MAQSDIDKLVKFLEGLPKEMDKEITKISKLYAGKMQAKATEDAPYDTGYLAGSINIRKMKGQNAYVVYVGAEYGGYVEFGTARTYPQPFFYPAFRETMDEYIKALERIMEKCLAD